MIKLINQLCLRVPFSISGISHRDDPSGSPAKNDFKGMHTTTQSNFLQGATTSYYRTVSGSGPLNTAEYPSCKLLCGQIRRFISCLPNANPLQCPWFFSITCCIDVDIDTQPATWHTHPDSMVLCSLFILFSQRLASLAPYGEIHTLMVRYNWNLILEQGIIPP